MPNGQAKPKRKRSPNKAANDVVLIPFRVEELKGLVLEKMGTAKNRGGRPRKV
jgi:hypothetical protein